MAAHSRTRILISVTGSQDLGLLSLLWDPLRLTTRGDRGASLFPQRTGRPTKPATTVMPIIIQAT